MKILHNFYERHIVTKEMGILHFVSETEISDAIAQTMFTAAQVLYHQYGANRLGKDEAQEGVSICIQHLPDIEHLMGSGPACFETDRQLYLVNPLELIGFYQSNPETCFQLYLMSDPLYVDFHKLVKFETNKTFDDVIVSAFEQAGLLYAIVSDRKKNA